MSKSVSAYSEILSLINKYVEGLSRMNDKKLRSVFHSQAQLFGIMAGKMVIFPIETWIQRVMGDPKPATDAKITPPPSSGDLWYVTSIKVLENIATAVVVCRFLEVWYTDFMTLLFENDEWKIVNKTFTYEKAS